MKGIDKVWAVLLVAVSWASAQGTDARLNEAYERLDAFIAQEMKALRTPGAAVALVTRDRVLRVSTYGFADSKARTPVAPDTRFEIGSISKAFTATAVLQLRERGAIDLDEPVTEYLPWFKVQSKFAPITLHHLLTHTSGLPRDRDDIPSSPYQVYALRERSTGFAPGTRFAYSNLGYQVLGQVIEQVTGEPYPQVIRRGILEPLGMNSTDAAVTNETRKRMAVGYVSLYDDRAAPSSTPLVEAPWMEYAAGDGSIASTPGDMAIFLRMLLNRGSLASVHTLSEESFRLMTQGKIKADETNSYGYGIYTRDVQRHTFISHAGSMLGFGALLVGDIEGGVGVVVLVNGPATYGRVGMYALRLVRAALQNQELPSAPTPVDSPRRVIFSGDFSGTYRSAAGKTLRFEADGYSLWLIHEGRRIPLERRSGPVFVAEDPEFSRFAFVFGRETPEPVGRPAYVVEVFHGSDWYVNEHYSGPRTFEVPKEWASYVGHYRSASPAAGNFRIVLRKDRLWMIVPGVSGQPLVQIESGLFELGEGETLERLKFDAIVNDKALRCNFSGSDFYRTFTP